MTDRAHIVLSDLLATHRDDILLASSDDREALKRIRLTSRYGQDDIEAAARLLAATCASLAAIPA